MRVFSCLLKKELRSYFYSPIAYISLFIFWLLSGMNFYWVLLQLSEGERAISIIQLLFCGPLIIFSLPVIVPLITMKLFSEETKTGTIELLYTSPINPFSIIFSKFLSSLVVYFFLWIPLIIQIFVLPFRKYKFGNSGTAIDRYADGQSFQTSSRSIPFLPVMFIGRMKAST